MHCQYHSIEILAAGQEEGGVAFEGFFVFYRFVVNDSIASFDVMVDAAVASKALFFVSGY